MNITSVYKATFGYKESDEKHEGTHVLISNEEWERLLNTHSKEVSDLKKEFDDEKKYLNFKLKNEQHRRESSERDAEEAQLNEANAKKQAAFEVDQMKRIVRDKANKKRDIPRRAPGYFVVDVEECRLPTGDGTAFKTTVSTPWPNELPLPTVKEYCCSDCFGDLFDDLDIIERSNITERNAVRSARERYNCGNGHPVPYMILFRTGREFWEAKLLHFGYVHYGSGGRKPKAEEEVVEEIPHEAPAPRQHSGHGMRM